MELQRTLPRIEREGLGLVAISYDSPAILRAFADEHGITFPLLSDTGSKTIRAWGLLNTTVPETDKYFGYPHPGTFIVDRRQTVTARFFEQGYAIRNTAATILTRLGSDPRGGSRVETAHLTLTTSVTDALVTRGTKFSVVLDVAPKRGMHVYAPPQAGYKTLALNVNPNPHYHANAVTFPAGETLLFKPLNERVQVYKKPVRLFQDVVILPTKETFALAQAGNWEVTVAATLDYQACDDRICYSPMSIPLSWTVKVLPNVMPDK